MDSPGEKRKHRRIPVNIPISIYLKDRPHQSLEGLIIDISEGGAFIHCTAPITIGSEVLVEIQFAETKLLEAKVVETSKELRELIPKQEKETSLVRWARGTSSTGFGVEFIGQKEDRQKFLARLVLYFERLKKAGVSFE